MLPTCNSRAELPSFKLTSLTTMLLSELASCVLRPQPCLCMYTILQIKITWMNQHCLLRGCVENREKTGFLLSGRELVILSPPFFSLFLIFSVPFVHFSVCLLLFSHQSCYQLMYFLCKYFLYDLDLVAESVASCRNRSRPLPVSLVHVAKARLKRM